MNKLIRLSVAFIILACVPLISFSQDSLKLRPFGIGLRINPLNLAEINGLDQFPTPKVLLIINPTNRFRLEPEFSFYQRNGSRSKTYSVGLGGYYQFQRAQTNFYTGVYGGVTRGVRKGETPSNMGSVKYTSVDEIFSVGPVFGGEYFFTPHFSLGGELTLRWAIYKDYEQPEVFEDNIDDLTYVYTGASLFVRFFL
jgi:hypothetical protein